MLKPKRKGNISNGPDTPGETSKTSDSVRPNEVDRGGGQSDGTPFGIGREKG